MTNLLMETEGKMSYYGLHWEDVDFIACEDFSISIDNFREIAAITDYNSGYGTAEVAVDLIIMFKDGSWFERHDYDGSEWWVRRQPPRKPRIEQEVDFLAIPQRIKYDYGSMGDNDKLNIYFDPTLNELN